MSIPSLSHLVSQHDYDPNSMSVAKARQYIAQFLQPVTQTERLPIMASLGRILAESVVSPLNVPNHDNSAMDGYAFHFASYQQQALKVVGAAFAGQPYLGEVGAGECVRIMTGAVIPAGVDTVVPQERVQVTANADGQDMVSLNDAPKQAMNVRYAGEDLQQGQVVLAQGHAIRAADLGLLASLGQAEVLVYRKLKVAFFSTGDELTAVGQPLAQGQIYDSNRYTLFGMLTRLGVEIVDLGAIPDDIVQLEQTLMHAANIADVVITSGGVSVGEADYMKQLLAQLGQVLFWKIAIKPGRPLSYGKIGSAHYFGLPGNPVAVMVTFYQFVREALLLIAGQKEVKPQPLLQVACTQAIKKLPGRTEFLRGILQQNVQGLWQVSLTGNQSSGVLSSMSLANCFIVLDENTGNLEAGSVVQVQVMEGVV